MPGGHPKANDGAYDSFVMTPRLNDSAEERLHPSRYLGYDRDRIGLHLLSKEIYDVAESQFRRAVYLNPYESAFSQHLAWALHKLSRFHEAWRWIETSLSQKPDDPDSQYIARRIREALPGGTDRDQT